MPASGSPGEVSAWRRWAAGVLSGGPWSLAVPLLGALLVLTYPVYSGNAYWIREMALIAVLALVVSGVNLSFGYAGEIQFGQLFMYALGGYLTAILAIHGLDDIIILVLIGGGAATLIGLLVAIPALRLGGWSLAIASFFLIICIPDLVGILGKWTGGQAGLFGIPLPKFFGRQMSSTALFYACVVTLIIWLTVYRNLVTSRYGVIFRTLRESPVLVGSIGYSPFKLKLLAYALGSLPAGMAGCFAGFLDRVQSPDLYALTIAIGIIAASILGGKESVYGAVLGAVLLQLGPDNSLSFAQYAPLVYGAFLILAGILFRRGLSGLGWRVAGRLRQYLLRGEDGPSPVATAAEPPATTLSFEGLVAGGSATLSVEGVSKAFGGVRALNDVSLSARPGEVTALIGANGSGKTTMLNVICGYVQLDSGKVELGSQNLTRQKSYRIARLGVGRTFQTPTVPTGVSVVDVVASRLYASDNCGVGSSMFRLPRYWKARKLGRDRALAVLQFAGLSSLAQESASALSLGTRRLVEVARALVSDPQVLLLDEPASGLNDEEIVRLGRIVSAAADAGIAVVLIERNFGFVRTVSDKAFVLHLGSLIASGTPDEVAKEPSVIESFLGGQSDEGEPSIPARTKPAAAASGPKANGTPALEARNLVSGYLDLQVLRKVSFSLTEGSLELILGRNGVGKTTLLSALSGMLPVWEGQVLLDGHDIGSWPAYRRARSGVALVPEGKRIFRHRTVMQNVELGTYSVDLNRKERRERCDGALDQFPILRERANQLAGGLSGGQQQMLAIAQALASGPRVLLLDEPSSGLAPAVVGEVFASVRGLCDSGITILLVEQLADQALPIADHVTVINEGKIVATGPPERFVDLSELQAAYFAMEGEDSDRATGVGVGADPTSAAKR